MQNEIEKLMRPRFEVIADYPRSPFKVGDVIKFEVSALYTEPYHKVGASVYFPENFKQYPHLFRELKWWEKRKIEEMPMYVSKSGVIFKVSYWPKEPMNADKVVLNTGVYFTEAFSPATEAEYKGEGE